MPHKLFSIKGTTLLAKDVETITESLKNRSKEHEEIGDEVCHASILGGKLLLTNFTIRVFTI